MKISEIKLGHSEEVNVKITDEKIQLFAKATGDHNPVHLDEEFAATTQFKKRIAHGMLSGSLFSTIFGTVYPGEGSIYLKQSLTFTAPVYIDEVLNAKVTVKEIIAEKGYVIFDTVATNENDKVVCKGEATIYLQS